MHPRCFPFDGEDLDFESKSPMGVPVEFADAGGLAITNLEHGQTIHVEVRCVPGSTQWEGLAERLLKLVRIRQPTELHLVWPPGFDPTAIEGYAEIDDALRDVGGTVVRHESAETTQLHPCDAESTTAKNGAK